MSPTRQYLFVVLSLIVNIVVLSSCSSDKFDVQREFQATPTKTVEKVFAMMDEFSDDFIGFNILDKEEDNVSVKTFRKLFWHEDNKIRCACIYAPFYDKGVTLKEIIKENHDGDFAEVIVAIDTFDVKNEIITLELKRKGKNWYVYELKTEKTGEKGFFQRAKELGL